MKRTYISGAAKCQRAAEEKEKIRKLPKVTDWLKSAEPEPEPSHPELEPSHSQLKPSHPETEPSHSECGPSHLEPELSHPQQEIVSYPTDLAEWPVPVTSDMRKFWLIEGSKQCQNIESNYSASRTADSLFLCS